MRCPDRDCYIFSAKDIPKGWGDVTQCSRCKRYYASDGTEVKVEDLPKYNPGKEDRLKNLTEEEEWQELWNGSAGF